VGATVLQFTDTGFADVTSSTIQEINSNRWNRNKYFKEFRSSFETISQETIDQYRNEVYESTYMKEPCSSTSPVLNDENLAVLVKNDPTEISQAFYPDKFKDRWKKGK
jgi:glutathionyl-hydroquinone reductase